MREGMNPTTTETDGRSDGKGCYRVPDAGGANGTEKKAAVMNENDPPALLGQALLDAIRQAVREEIQAAAQSHNGSEDGDRLLDAAEAAKLMCVSEDWLYRHAKRLPFSRKLGPKLLRFSLQGIQKYLALR